MVAANSRQDDELTTLLTKLYEIQEDIGSKPKTSSEEKAQKAAQVAMGQGKKAQAKGGKFLELKASIIDRLKIIHANLKDTKAKEEAGFGGDNAKDIIKLQSEVREQLRQAGDEWKQMDEIYKKEARKKKSKFTQEELEVQSTLVQRLHAEIEKVKEAQMVGYARGRQADSAVGLNTKSIYSDSTNGKGSRNSNWKGTGGGAAMTGDQRLQLEQIDARDADFDTQLDEIGEGIQDLAEIAALQGEEVARQSVMLDKVNDKMDKVNERMGTVNSKMKATLDEVGRSPDKICVDIMCVVLMVGFAAVIYKFITQG